MVHRLILILVLAVSGLMGSGQLAGGAGTPLYPDLRTEPPSQLQFDTTSSGTHILRFSNTVWNAGRRPTGDPG